MKQALMAVLNRLGHFQAQFILTLLFWLVLTPYALFLRLFVKNHFPVGHWVVMDKRPASLDDLRRSF